MADLIVIAFDSEAKAEEARGLLMQAQKEYLIELGDAVIAEKRPDGTIKLHQIVNTTAAGAASGALWGSLIGLLFLNPLLGAAFGAAGGAAAGAFTDFGIDDAFIKQTAEVLSPGQAALCVLVRKVTADKVLPRLAPLGGTVLKTNLDDDKELALRNALAGQPTA